MDILILFEFFFLMFNAIELLTAIGPSGWPSHYRFPTINWPTVRDSLNDFLHAGPEEGFTVDPLGKDTNLSLPVLSLL